MKNGILTLLAFFFTIPLLFAIKSQSYMAYIEEWKEVAQEQQEAYGIPACITLAQALLESSAGQSELALNANNHFGIKCTSDWFGDVYRYDDDKKNECFRVYLDAKESFKDHSLFLQRPRYQQLFSLDMGNYKAWAQGLKDYGYATDPLYATKLISIIEEYDLACGMGMPSEEQYVASKPETIKKAHVVTKTDPIRVVHSDPQPEYQAPRTQSEEKKLFLLLHKKMKQNGCSYVLAQEGDTYANIAFRLNVKERNLRIWNDALDRDLQVNERVYMGPKKTYAEQEKEVLWVHPNESLWFISQREGMKLETIYKLNGIDRSVLVFKTRQKILLRKPKKEK